MAQGTTPPFTRALVDMTTGKLTREGYTFLVTLNNNVAQAGAGVVSTLPGSGLSGGGTVADGVDLSIANNGVSNAMLRQSVGTSVIGRYAGTTGNVADIQAVQNGTVLTRQGNQLAFTTNIDVADVRTDTFRIDQAPVAEVIVATHTLTISLNGTDYKIPCVAA